MDRPLPPQQRYVEVVDSPTRSTFMSPNLRTPTEAENEAFYYYHRNRPNPFVDDFMRELQGSSGREYQSAAPATPRAFPLAPYGRGMAPPTTPRQSPQVPAGQVIPREYDTMYNGRYNGAASNMGSTDMRANPDAMSMRPNDPISEILVRGGMPPMR